MAHRISSMKSVLLHLGMVVAGPKFPHPSISSWGQKLRFPREWDKSQAGCYVFVFCFVLSCFLTENSLQGGHRGFWNKASRSITDSASLAQHAGFWEDQKDPRLWRAKGLGYRALQPLHTQSRGCWAQSGLLTNSRVQGP